MRIPLFDIDGTLCSAQNTIHADAFAHAGQTIYQVKTTLQDLGHSPQGMIDPQILTELLTIHGVSQPAIQQGLAAAMTAMAEYFESRATQTLQPLPGVREILKALEEQGILTGVLTGNVGRIGWRKLELAGIRNHFTFGAFGDMAQHRVQLVPIARAQVLALGIAQPSLVIIGDTPRDIACAKAAKIVSVGVASGEFSSDQLVGADLVLQSLQPIEPLLTFLLEHEPQAA